MRPLRSPWTIVLLLLVLRAALLALSVDPGRPLTGDEPAYDDVARSLLAGEGFLYHGRPWIWKPPLWPAAWAAVRAVLGEDLRWSVFVQGLFDAGAALLVGLTAGRLFGRRALWTAIALMATWPPFLRESRLLQTEPIFTLMVSLTLYAFVRFAQRPGALAALACGAAAGLAMLVRPNGIVPLAGLVLGWLLVDPRARREAPHLAVLALGAVLVVLPWTVRNAVTFSAFIPFSSGGGEVFAMGTSVASDGRWDRVVWVQERDSLLRADSLRLGRPLGVAETDRALYRIGRERWAQDPAVQFQLWLRRLWRTVALPIQGGEAAVRTGFLLALAGVYGLALAGARDLMREPPGSGRLGLALLVAFAVNALALSAVASSSRYIEPVRTFPMVLVAGVVARAWQRRFGGA